MSEYISKFTGPEIDERLEKAEVAYTQSAENTEQLITKPGLKNPDNESSEIFNDYKDNVASGYYAHAEGRKTTASGHRAHSEGTSTKASGDSSHAEGFGTVASGSYSHAEGWCTHATAAAQHVGGKYNIVDEEKKYAEIIGNGDETSTSNARTLDWDGNAWHAGDVKSTDPETSETISLNSTAALAKAIKNEVERNTDDLAEYALSNEDAHYDLGLKISENGVLGALLHTATGTTAKNLLKNIASSTTKNGITFTVNDDGSVTASGTASANTQLDIGKFSLTAGTEYILSGCPDGGSESSYYLYGLYTSNWAGLGGKDTGNGYKFTAQWNGEVVFRVYITSGTTIDNLTFYPMLRYAAIEDGTYEIYTPSLLERIEALEGHIASISGGTE